MVQLGRRYFSPVKLLGKLLHTNILFIFFLMMVTSHVGKAATITSNQAGNWGTASTWVGGIVPAVTDDVVINHAVTISLNTTVGTTSIYIGTSGKLTINGTLILNGNLSMANNAPELITGSESYVIIYGSAILDNKVSIDLSSYFIVLGDFIRNGANNQGDITVAGAHIYIFGTVDTDWNNFTACNEGSYDGTTTTVGDNCDAGKFQDLLEHVDPDDLPPDVFDDIVDAGTTQRVSLEASATTICPGNYVTLLINDTNTPLTNISWLRDNVKIISNSGQSSVDMDIDGTYYAVYKSNGLWYTTNTVTLTAESNGITMSAPAFLSGGNVSCMPAFSTYNDFLNAATMFPTVFSSGGMVTTDCSPVDGNTFQYSDVYASGACPIQVTRTYSISNEANNTATVIEVFTMNDTQAPVINNGNPLSDISAEPGVGCVAALMIDEPTLTDNCGYGTVAIDVASSPVNASVVYDENTRTVSGNFPIGETLLTWVVTDICGNTATATQTITIVFPLTPISYDNGSNLNDVGSGVKPMLTSTHNYQVDGGVEESGYTYLWEIYTDDNNNGLIDGPDAAITTGFTVSPNNTGAEVDITFDNLTEDKQYIISLIKTKTSTSCTKQELLPVKIRENMFDVSLDNLADQCQAVGAGTTTYFWNISFPAVSTEPFEFTYEITRDAGIVSSGTIDNIYSADNWVLTPGSGTAPLVQTSKSDPYKVVLYFTFYNIPDSDIDIGISIQATDTYQVSDPNVSNNSDDLKAFEIPAISFE